MTTTVTRAKTAFTIIAGLSLVGSLAGCAVEQTAVAGPEPTDTTETTTPTATPVPTSAAPTPMATTPAATSTYHDGTYTGSGSYRTPEGSESVQVTITLASDIVTTLTVVGSGSDRESLEYQGEFINGIAAVVVGQDIDTLSVSRVAGSSLTSAGFTTALEAIKAQAL